MVLASIGLSWFAVKMQKARRQREAVAAIEAAGGRVWYVDGIDVETPSGKMRLHENGPPWLRKILGEDFFTDVDGARIPNDGGMEHVKGLPELRILQLQSTEVTDAGLRHLMQVPQLDFLDLNGTLVTDAGLEYVGQLPRLRWLHLDGTLVTDAGLEHIKQLTRLEELFLTGTRVTDAGLEHLKDLPQLQVLHLDESMVAGEGARKLHEALPNCLIAY
jgi:Leucine-rich repeat (LRR) protein